MEKKLKAGEKVFSLLLLIIGLGALYESIKMYLDEPNLASYGALPLFLSGSIVLLMVKILVLDRGKKEAGDKEGAYKDRLKAGLALVFARDLVVIILLLIAYALALYLGLGFEIPSFLFLFVSMTYLMDGRGLVKNLIYSFLSLVFILLVFSLIFNVILP